MLSKPMSHANSNTPIAYETARDQIAGMVGAKSYRKYSSFLVPRTGMKFQGPFPRVLFSPRRAKGVVTPMGSSQKHKIQIGSHTRFWTLTGLNGASWRTSDLPQRRRDSAAAEQGRYTPAPG